MDGINLWLIMPAALMATASPGPSNVMIASTAIAEGRSRALVLVCGILTGSLFWSCAAAMGLGAVMHANVWMVEALRYLGAAYLLFLAFKAMRSALTPAEGAGPTVVQASMASDADSSSRAAYFKGLGLHLTNPKVIFFFGSLYAIGVPAEAPARAIVAMILLILLQSALVFFGYALLFSDARIARGYLRLRRGFDAVFAGFFALAGVKVLTARL